MTELASELQNLPMVRGTYKFNEPLKNYTWLNVGGPADIMFFPKDIADLQYFLQNKPAETEVFVIGGGANLLVRDAGIKGVVIKLKEEDFCKISVHENFITCGAGLLNVSLKKTIIEKGLGGLEFLCTIPGSIGGTVRSNAGCFGREISDVLVKAKIIDGCGNIFEVKNEDFHFAYRHSDFPEDWIVYEVCLKYEPETPEKTAAKVQEQLEYRKAHQPQGIRTAGSTFKNPPAGKAWELIKNSGASELHVGGAKMSPQHCNFLQNDGNATADDIENLCQEIVKKVKDKFGIRLETEIKTVGRR